MAIDFERVIVIQREGLSPTTYDFCRKELAPLDDLARALKYKHEQVQFYQELAEMYATNSNKEKELEYLQKADLEAWAKYEIMTFTDFQKLQKDFYCNPQIIEVTEDDYWEHLEVLPPEYHGTINGVTMFCMGERTTGTFTAQYAKYNGRYFCATVDMADRSTWICNRLNELPEEKEQC